MTHIRIRSIRRYSELRLAVQQPGHMLVHSACSLVTSGAAYGGPTTSRWRLDRRLTWLDRVRGSAGTLGVMCDEAVEIRELRVFVAVARKGSLSAAVRKLHLS